LIAYKFLREDGRSIFTGFRWEPGGEAGGWVDAGRAVPCRSGVHACRAADLPLWVGPNLFEVELGGKIVEGRDKLTAPRGRLLGRVDAWNDQVRDAYTRMCADRAHELAVTVEPPLDSWDAMVEQSVPEGPALLGFVAARIAEEVSGRDGYRAERAHQAAWLVDRLGLKGKS
jgi:hypothetical protein